MKIDKGANVAVVVNRTWANLHGVKMFLRSQESSQADIRGVDESHVLFAKVLDAEQAAGLWIEVHPSKNTQHSAVEPASMLIPWRQVLAIVVAQQFSLSTRQEARRIGFTGEMDPE